MPRHRHNAGFRLAGRFAILRKERGDQRPASVRDVIHRVIAARVCALEVVLPLIALVSLAPASMGWTKPMTVLEIKQGERLLVVAPHPDDETLGAGGLIQRVVARGGEVRIVLVTAGDGYVEAVTHETGQLRPAASAYIGYGERRLR